MIPLTEVSKSLLEATIFRFVKAWKIERTDGVIHRFTSHDHTIAIAGEEYIPAYAASDSALRAETGMKAHNRQFLGFISSESITLEAIKQKRFANAQITEYMTDWLYPELIGSFYNNIYFVTSVVWDGVSYKVELRSLSHRLKKVVGDNYQTDCRHRFGDNTAGGCSLDIEDYSYPSSPLWANPDGEDEDDPKRIVHFDPGELVGAGLEDDFFANGCLVGKPTGSENAGMIREIKKHEYYGAKHHIELQLAMPENMTSSGEYRACQGCDKKIKTCHDEYGNEINHGGFFLIPGSDLATWTPDSI
jgi:uncharacterized phage protein (TIGR02218 family)